MKKIAIVLCALILAIPAFAQSVKKSQEKGDMYVGMNLLQYTSLTINANFSTEYKPWLTGFADVGYAINYSNSKSYDVLGYILTPHIDANNDGYDLSKQNGGYIKLGGFYNFRKTYEKKNYIHLGLFLNNAYVYEKANFIDPVLHIGGVEKIHGVLISGLSVSAGYEFEFLKYFSSSIDFQVSLPAGNYKNLYGYSNFIPGMGHKDYNGYWFPMLIWNVKYKL